ncbi:MAG: hypothetical protein HYV09_13100 [Deltaproteobacteria bacterium]|nr:hypothetical protein [Deltaproteobacteria bacterium]
MSFPVFEAACVVVVVATLIAMSRARGAGPVLRDYAALAVAGWIGEQTCIELYRFYTYAAGWHLHVGHVPILVPLIWPLVILSAREVVDGLWPGLRVARPLAVAAIVVVDASLVEVVAVRAGLWSWAEPGHLAVPVIGILGWGYFAAGAELALMKGRPLAALVVGPVVAHALILGTWWGLFRWTVRGDHGVASSVVIALLSAVAVVVVARARREGRAMALSTAAPRMIAASLFFTLLVTTAPRDPRLWAHVASVAVPYLAATRFRGGGTRSPAAPREATA